MSVLVTGYKAILHIFIFLHYPHMKKMLFFTPIILLVLSGCGSVSVDNQSSNSPVHSTNGQRGTPPSSSSAGNRFADQSYYNYSYLISGDALSTKAQQAVSGFQVTKQNMPDGTIQITLKALNPEYHDQQYTLKTGEQLYFIEMSLGDDPSISEERNLRDDTAVVVDAQGNVVQEPRDFSQ